MTLGAYDSSNTLSRTAVKPDPKPASGATGGPRRGPDPAPVSSTPDQFQPQQLLGPTTQQPIVSHLQLELEDKDGLANFGEHDIKATVSGDILISPQFLLEKLSGLKGDKEKKFDKPVFDAERRQFVISGTALNKILGFIDIGFEIRLGVVKGELGFRVDSGLKRGSIYEDLTKMLKEQGLATYEKDGMLFIKPEYKQTIALPALADQPARIDKIGATANNLRFEIGADGQIKIQLKQVPVEMSSQTGVTNPLKATADKAQLKVDLGFDSEFHPNAQIRDGQVKASAGNREMAKYLPEDGRALLAEQLGTALTVSLTGLHGQLRKGQQGLVLNTSGQVNVSNSDGSAHVSASVNAALRGGDVAIDARKADVQLKDGTRATAGGIQYDGRQKGLNLKVQDLDGHLVRDGVSAEVEDLTGQLTRSEAGILRAQLSGKTKGHVQQDGIQADFATSGTHLLKIEGRQIVAKVDQADVSGNYQQTAGQAKEPEAGNADPRQISLTVRQISANGKVTTPAATIDAQASQGSLQLDLGAQGQVSVKTTARMNLSAQGEKVQGKAVLPQGAEVNLDAQGIKIDLKNAELEGKFDNPKKLKVDGKVTGDVDVKVGKDGKIAVEARDGNFDANFALKDKVKVKGKGETVSFTIDKQENISLDLGNTQASTTVTAGKVRLKAETTGKRAQVSVINDDVKVQTTDTQSTLDINVNNILKGKGKAGDVTVTVDSQPKGDDVHIKARQADVKAQIQNKKGNLKVGVDTKAEIDVHVDPKDNVTVSSKQAKSKIDLSLRSPDGQQEKIKVDATGTDFKVSVKDDSKVGIELQKAGFKGRITPNPDMAVDVESTAIAPIKVNVDEGETETEVRIRAQAAVKGSVRIDRKIDAEFRNPSGFEVDVKDKPSGTDVHTRLKSLELRGRVNTPEAKLAVDGKGDLDLKIIDDEDVKVLYDGHLLGDVDAGGIAAGKYGVNGKVSVDVHGSDIDVEAKGSIQGQLKSQAHGVGADLTVNGGTSPIKVRVKDNKVSVEVKEGGQIHVQDLKQLKLGQPDPKLNEILAKLESNDVLVSYRDLKLQDAGKTGHVKLETEGVKTTYGEVAAGMELEKNGDRVYVTKGQVAFAPNRAFYELIQNQINEKYNIRISGEPSFENGEIKIKGELRSKIGLVQWADFNIKTRVVDNKLVFDLDKARVLKVIGKGTIGDVANSVLSKTDIDVFRKGPGTIEIALADIVKDLALTEGVNFTGLKLVDNRFEVGFRYDSQDLEVAKLAAKKDIPGLKRYMASQSLATMSGESISTAYNTYVEAKDKPAAAGLMLDSLKAYTQVRESGQIERALLWMSKSHVAHKADVDDDITLDVLKQLRLETSAGQKLVRALPIEVVRTLADNLDKTISQGGGFSWISGEERELANRLRELKGLPLNHRVI